MYINNNKILDEAIELRALDYLANHRETSTIQYLEIHGGSIITASMINLGIAAVVNRFEKKIAELS